MKQPGPGAGLTADSEAAPAECCSTRRAVEPSPRRGCDLWLEDVSAPLSTDRGRASFTRLQEALPWDDSCPLGSSTARLFHVSLTLQRPAGLLPVLLVSCSCCSCGTATEPEAAGSRVLWSRHAGTGGCCRGPCETPNLTAPRTAPGAQHLSDRSGSSSVCRASPGMESERPSVLPAASAREYAGRGVAPGRSLPRSGSSLARAAQLAQRPRSLQERFKHLLWQLMRKTRLFSLQGWAAGGCAQRCPQGTSQLCSR